MLQRIQTVYLALAAAASGLAFFFPLAHFYGGFDETKGNFRFYISGMKNMINEPHGFPSYYTAPLIVVLAVSILLSVFTILKYRNRMFQMRLCAFNILSIIVLVMLVFFFYVPKITAITGIDPAYQVFGMVLPLVTLLLLVLAYHAIRKDEALVKAADRLR